MAGAILATVLPDLDLVAPRLLAAAGIEHTLDSGVHHRWMTHTPLFWSTAVWTARRAASSPRAPGWAAEATGVMALGVAVHLLQDSVANTVSLLWPMRRRNYGLGLDRMPEVTDHLEYTRRYPLTPAGWLEAAVVLSAAAVAAAERRRGKRAPPPAGR